MFVQHPPAVIDQALQLLDEGKTLRATAAELGVSRHTVRNWRRGRLPQNHLASRGADWCGTCGAVHPFEALACPAYPYLLGLYLGDGCLARQERTWSLRLEMDVAYPRINKDARRAMELVSPTGGASIHRYPGRNSVTILGYSRSWRCLFPQHGPGKKHQRRIALEPWQERLVHRDPRPFVRGLIQSDGWRGLNRVTVKGRNYAYPRYQFSNRSDDIRRLFTDACDLLGIAWRPWGRWHISVARRDAVARMDEFVGPKE